MEVKIQAIHFDATEKLQEFIEKKVAKFGKFSEEIRKVEVSLKVVKPETSMNKEASIKVLASTGEFFAEKVCDTFEEAIIKLANNMKNSKHYRDMETNNVNNI